MMTFSLERHLRSAGYTDIEINATGGWHMAMAQMLGLWVRRSSITHIDGWKYTIIRNAAYRFQKWLLKIAEFDRVSFNDDQMITGLYGTARKSKK